MMTASGSQRRAHPREESERTVIGRSGRSDLVVRWDLLAVESETGLDLRRIEGERLLRVAVVGSSVVVPALLVVATDVGRCVVASLQVSSRSSVRF